MCRKGLIRRVVYALGIGVMLCGVGVSAEKKLEVRSLSNIPDQGSQAIIDLNTDYPIETNGDYASKRLILYATGVKDTYGAIDYAYSNNILVLQYDTEADTRAAYEKFKQLGYYVSVDVELEVSTDGVEESGSGSEELGNVGEEVGKDAADLDVRSLAKDTFVEPNAKELGFDKLNWYLENLENGKSPRNIGIAIVGSGWLTGKTKYDKRVVFNKDYTGIENPYPDSEHETEVGCLIMDNLPEQFKLYSYQIQSKEGSSKGEHHEVTLSGVCALFTDLTENDKIQVINMSTTIGMSRAAYNSQNDETKQVLSKIMDNFFKTGKILVTSAGNDASEIRYGKEEKDMLDFPQMEEDAWVISSVMKSKRPSAFSNWGDTVDFAGYGDGVRIKYNDGDTSMSVSGTSFSSPYVASLVAGILSTGLYDEETIYKAMTEYCFDDTLYEGPDNHCGHGIPYFSLKMVCDVERKGCNKITEDVEPHCNSTGYHKVLCDYCATQYEYEFLPMVGHSYKEVIHPSTCTIPGSKETRCEWCNLLSAIEDLPLEPHKLVVDEHPATCEEDGYTITTCENCGYYQRRTLSKTGHSYEVLSEVAPTCDTAGVKHLQCTRCGEAKDETVAKLGHDYSVLVDEVLSTCTVRGHRTYKCTKCGGTKTQSLPLDIVNHGETYFDDQHLACTQQGFQFDICKDCGRAVNKYFKKIYPHSFVVDYETDDYIYYKCLNCWVTERKDKSTGDITSDEPEDKDPDNIGDVSSGGETGGTGGNGGTSSGGSTSGGSGGSTSGGTSGGSGNGTSSTSKYKTIKVSTFSWSKLKLYSKGRRIIIKEKKKKLKSYNTVELRYATNKKMKGAKVKSIKVKGKAGKRTITSPKLKKGKTYYIQVRYRVKKGKVYYISKKWSSKKKIKIK